MTALLQDMVQDRLRYIMLKNLLEEQRTLLLKRNSEKLEKMSEELINIYNLLSDSAKRRNACLSSLGVTTNTEGFNNLISKLDAEKKSKISQLLADIKQQAQLCQQKNEINGIILQMQQDVILKLTNDNNVISGIYHP